MALIPTRDRAVAAAVAELVDCNPFLPTRIELEQRALGNAFVSAPAVWHAEGDSVLADPNAPRLRAVVERLATELHQRLRDGAARRRKS